MREPEPERRHRYALACEIAAGRRVLDIACGEGHGSAMLAEVAQHVVGVDISREAIAHLGRRYSRPNLEFKVGACVAIPLESQSIDLVVSFETIDHHDERRQMLVEIKRVLRPGGVLVISTADRREDSVQKLLASHFERSAVYGWRPDGGAGMPRPQHLVAVASDGALPPAPSGVVEEPLSDRRRQLSDLQAELAAQTRKAEAAHEQLQAAAANARVLETELSSERQRRAEIERLHVASEERLRMLYASLSWRLTAPLRASADLLRGARRRTRVRLSAMGAGLRRLLANLTGPGSDDRVAPPSGSQFIASSLVTEPPAADGTHEWADYAGVRDRIDAATRQHLAGVSPAPRPMIDLASQDLLAAAARVALPDPGDHPDVSIIIPAYNNLKYTLECLLSVATHTRTDTRYEVIVADDASTDETRRALTRVPQLRLVSNDTNLGFLRTCNRAAGLARGAYLLFLNNDTQVTANWLEPMLRVLRHDPDVGAVGPMIVYPDGRLQEAGARIRRDGTAEMIGLFDSPKNPRFRYRRSVDYCSGACLLLETRVFRELGGFDERYAPAYYEDVDLCLRLRRAGRQIVYCPDAVVVHHLSATTASQGAAFKSQCIVRNLQALTEASQEELDRDDDVRIIAFYLPQFHPIPENDLWWGKGFTEWSNVTRARPNFAGHRQPRVPADLGYYDLRVPQVMEEQARLARRYGIHGFCFYYYWFRGKRLLEAPLERMLATGRPDIPFCLCWANENWTRRWDGRDDGILMAQNHSDDDDRAVIHDLLRHFRSPRYIRVHGKPLVLVYRVTLFPDFARTARLWRQVCREEGIGDIYIAMVESFELVRTGNPADYGCDAGVEFPPHEMAEQRPPSGEILNPAFRGSAADYRDLAVRFATRSYPGYTRFLSVMPGWDNTPRRQDDSFCFEHATPGAFQAWTEAAIERTKQQCSGDERLVFINAWNEWAEGAYLEPDRTFGHAFLEAVLNARDASALVHRHGYVPEVGDADDGR